jgi:NAD(P)-dependent dehydrogenase (short-subunit alcohol dehydrogenase family)
MTEVAIITGAAHGIGEAVARRLAAARVRCVLVDRDPLVNKVAADIGGIALVGDPSDPDLPTKAVAYADDRLDLLVLNARSDYADNDPVMLDLRGYHSAVAMNQHAIVYGLRAGLPLMRRRGSGSIVITASLAGLIGMQAHPFLTMTEHAIIGLVRAFSGPLAREGIRLNAVCPAQSDPPDQVAEAIEDTLRTAEPGIQLVLRGGESLIPYAPAPLL